MSDAYTDLDADTGGDYVKLSAGNVVTLHILSQKPEKSVIHWVNKKKSSCIGEECENCANGDKPKKRWVADVWDRKEQKVKKLEFGSMIASQLKGIAELQAEGQKTIHDTDIRIKTTGAELTTEYNVLPVPMTGIIPPEITEKYSAPF